MAQDLTPEGKTQRYRPRAYRPAPAASLRDFCSGAYSAIASSAALREAQGRDAGELETRRGRHHCRLGLGRKPTGDKRPRVIDYPEATLPSTSKSDRGAIRIDSMGHLAPHKSIPVQFCVFICTGETYKNVVKMTFAKGASLEDPSGLLPQNILHQFECLPICNRGRNRVQSYKWVCEGGCFQELWDDRGGGYVYSAKSLAIRTSVCSCDDHTIGEFRS